MATDPTSSPEGPEASGSAPASATEGGGPPAKSKGLRLRARWRLVRASARTLLWVTVGLVALTAFLLRTAAGHRVMLGWGLDQLRNRVAGTVEVDRIRSADLLSGARLVGVRLATPDGGAFVEADSIEASYSWRGLLGGALAFDGVRLWNPRVVLERDSSGVDTFARWLRGERPAGEGGGGPSLRLESVLIENGSFTLRLPGPDEPGGAFRMERGPDGALRRAIDLRSIDAHLRILSLDPDEGLRVDIGEGSTELDLLAERFVLDQLRGEVRSVGPEVIAELDHLRAPGIEGGGTVRVDRSGDDGMVTEITAAFERADLREWRWIHERVPALVGELALDGRLGPEGQRWTATEVEADWGPGRVAGRAGVRLGGSAPVFEEVDLDVVDLPVALLDRYFPEPTGLEGELTGRIALGGPPSDLRLEGEVTLVSPIRPPVTAAFTGGVLQRAGAIGFDGFEAVLDPMDWGVVGHFLPSMRLTGPGRAEVELEGTLREGLALSADLTHAPPGVPSSHLLVSGNLYAAAGDDRLRMDIQGDLAPLSLDAVALDYDSLALPLSGTLTGPVRARGILRDLEVRAALTTREGEVELVGQFDLRDPGERYRIDATVTDFLASALSPALPQPTEVTGRLQLEGSGLDPATLMARGSMEVDRADVRGVTVDSAWAALRVEGGAVAFDTMHASVAGIDLRGGGTLAADSTGPAGRVRVAFEAPDLTGVRAIFRGDTVLTSDDLTALDRDVLELSGVDPDTLPLAADVAAEGRLRGEMVLDGSIRRFDATGWLEAEELMYGRTSVGSARLDLQAADLPGLAGEIHADLTVGPTVVAGRAFTAGAATIDFTRPEGRAEIELRRDSTEDYRLAGRFELDSLGGAVELERAVVRLDSLEYHTRHPSRIVWTDSELSVDSMSIVGSGADPVWIRAAGVLPRRGEADFQLDIEGLDLGRLTRVAQREDLEWAGRLDFDGRVQGTAARPIVSGNVAARDLAARNFSLERLEGQLDYAGREVAVDLDAWAGGQQVLRVEGDWPLSFTLDGSTSDVAARPVDLTLRADSLPASLVLALLEDLEDTRGTLTGQLEVGGTPAALEPRGVLRLAGGAWTVGALGVRQEQVEATFDVQQDRVVQVEATGRSGGTVDVSGTVVLDSLTSPALDLDIALASFNAVDRRDIAGAVSGQLQLQGRYGQPRILGSLQVERGDLFLDEFARNVGVVDLSDPRFFSFIDEEILTARPLLAETRNPFMNNLLVNIDLGVQRNTWIRSDQLDVEMRGDLIVTYDRRSRDVVMVGELEAVRGQYQFLGQNFEVEGGTVEFVGIPGINPDMNIQAVARVRRRQSAEPLEITAQVGGTLIAPTVELTTPDAAVSESDILSYIAVGQPASALTTNVSAAAGGFVGGFVGGSLTSSLAALAQGSSWIDFLSISQAFDASAVGAGSQGLGQSFAGTQVELGRYFGGDYFAALILRPLASAGTGGVLGGARIEWQASAQYYLEVFAEDRFLRTGAFGFREVDIESQLIFGFSLFREWGY